MQKADRLTKSLLTLLVVGVWGLLLRPLFSAGPAQAQQPRQYAAATAAGDGRVNIGGTARTLLDSLELQSALTDAPKKGWKLHSVLPDTQSQRYTVIFEK